MATVAPSRGPAQRSVGGAPHELLDRCLFVGRKLAQHVVGRAAWARLTDADPQSRDVVRADLGDHRAHAVVRARTATLSKPQRPERQVHLVIHDQHMFVWDAQPFVQAPNSLAAAIHERLRLRQHQCVGRPPPGFRVAAIQPTPQRCASSSTARKPTLWRVAAYSGPGLPRPTMTRARAGSTPANGSGRLGSKEAAQPVEHAAE